MQSHIPQMADWGGLNAALPAINSPSNTKKKKKTNFLSLWNKVFLFFSHLVRNMQVVELY